MEKTCCSAKPPKPASTLYPKIILYRPLIVITLISIGLAAILALTDRVPFMDGAMGFFLVFLSALKLFNVNGFAPSFAQYDLLASRVKPYALAYPFIELALGVLYLSGLWSFETNIGMLVIVAISLPGILNIIRSGQTVQCACVGSSFNLPVGRVTLLENLVMGCMALINLLH